MRRIVVVGGGITGLAAAHGLNAAAGRGGVDAVVLVEADLRLGGKILTDAVDGFLIEGGPDSFITLKPQAVQFARELGLGDRLVGTLDPRQVYVRHGGRLRPLPDGLAGLIPQRLGPFLRSPLFTPLEKARFGLDLLIPRSRNGSDESLGAFVRRRLGRAAVDRLASPLLAGIHAGDVERLSLRATFPQLAEAERRHGGLIRAVLAQQAAASEGPRAPAPMFMTLRGGLRELVDGAARALGRVEVRTGTRVLDVRRAGGGYVVTLGGERTLGAAAVILAVPAPEAARLLRGVNARAAEQAASVRSASTAVVALAFRRDQVRRPLDGHGYVGARSERTVHTACTWVSSKWPGRAPQAMVLLRCFVGRDGDQAAVDRDDADLVATITGELRGLLEISGEPVLHRVYRWRNAMPQYEVGHLERVAAMQSALHGTPGIIPAGSGFGGVGLPDCIRQGQEAARLALEVTGQVAPV